MSNQTESAGKSPEAVDVGELAAWRTAIWKNIFAWAETLPGPEAGAYADRIDAQLTALAVSGAT